MYEITLKRSDCIETVMPTVQAAMESGAVCRISNIDYLGFMEVLALTMLTLSNSLMDLNTGKTFQSRPGFSLIGVDQSGSSRVLALPARDVESRGR